MALTVTESVKSSFLNLQLIPGQEKGRTELYLIFKNPTAPFVMNTVKKIQI